VGNMFMGNFPSGMNIVTQEREFENADRLLNRFYSNKNVIDQQYKDLNDYWKAIQ